MKRKYDTDLTKSQWEAISARFKEINGNYGKNAEIPKWKLINAVLYKLKTGCQWRMLPKDMPKWSTVWTFYRRCKLNGIWEVITADMVRESRRQAGRSPEPTYSLIDSRSVKTASYSEEIGFDGGKKSERT